MTLKRATGFLCRESGKFFVNIGKGRVAGNRFTGFQQAMKGVLRSKTPKAKCVAFSSVLEES